MHAKQKLDLWF